MLHPVLKSRLQVIWRRQRQMRFWSRLTICWAATGLLAAILLLLGKTASWPATTWPWVGLFGAIAALFVSLRPERIAPDWRKLAGELERRHPDLDGRLLTAVQQEPDENGDFAFLQQRLVAEALQHDDRSHWADLLPEQRIRLAQMAHWLALALVALALVNLRVATRTRSSVAGVEPGVTISPGDTALERGSALVVLARFGGVLPVSVDLVLSNSDSIKRIPLVKSLADPMFGASVPEVSSNFSYRIEYSGKASRDFKVTVFEYPRLEHADADVVFPEYTGQQPKHVANTRRISAVEGSRLDLAFHFNKPVSSAELVPNKGDHSVVPLQIEKDHPLASLKQFPIDSSRSYELRLIDADGRTNKVPAQFVFEALTNRRPEIHLASPRGDQRPSPLEEITFNGTVWDDFGVKAFGLGYSVAGQEPKWIELGRNVPANEKRPFNYLLRLEDLGVEPDQLISWFVWADDVGPDGQSRRTTGDLFFGEVRPFEEVFREGQGMEGGQNQAGQSGGQEGGESGRLAELQKQIISATWKLQRDAPRTPAGRSTPTAEPQSRNESYRSYMFARTPALRFVAAAKPNHFAGLADATTDSSAVSKPSSDPLQAPLLSNQSGPHTYASDTLVVRDAQAQALDQAQGALENQQDSRTAALWRAAAKEMQRALARLQVATNSPAELKEALAAEQAAYQALLRLQEHEYQVARSRNRGQQGGSRNQQLQRQLEEMDLTQSENRYETQSEAQKPQPTQRREQLQVMNRLQELARRQQDLNDRLKELQTALQEAKTEEERAEIQRRLKRLQEEEQQMLADIDEVRQRMDRPENQSNMADERRQLDETRNEVQRAAEAAGQGAASQALAAGTRAQQQLQQARDQMRKENSSQFADDLRQMRSQARELAREQERLQQQMEQEGSPDHKSLSGSPGTEEIAQQFAQQKSRMTNLVERATEISQQAEQSEPLLSKQLYDTVRKFGQDTAKDVKDLQDDLISRGMMTQRLYDQLKESPEPDSAKLLELTSDLYSRHLLPQASQSGQRARTGIENLKRGVERAAESVLGDDTEALRLAQQELNQLTQELQREMNRAGDATGTTNSTAAGVTQVGPGLRSGVNGTNQVSADALQAQAGQQLNHLGDREQSGNQDPSRQGNSENGQQAQAQGGQPGSQNQSGQSGQPGEQAQAGGQNQNGDRNQSGQLGEQAQAGGQNQSGGARTASEGSDPVTRNDQASRAGGAVRRGGYAGGDWVNGGGVGGDWSGNPGNYLNRLLVDDRLRPYGPITGEDFVNWADRLRDVEEVLDDSTLRNQVAVARERARVLRQAFKQERKKPDWAVVQLQVIQPLAEVRDRIADELAHRDSRQALVPIDRDPVPDKYSDLVRRYYEGLGKDK